MRTAIDKNIIEQIKTGLIVVLMISTILLLYFFWGDFSLEDFKLMDSQRNSETMDVKELLVPSQVIISLGEDSYKLINEEKWAEMVQGVKEFAESETLVVEEITKEQYEKVINTSSIRAKFDYQISLSEFCNAYGIKTTPSFDNIETLSEMGYGMISKESLLLYDQKKNKYYRLVSTNFGEKLDNLITSQIEADGPIYFTVGNYLGGDVNNDTLIPISLETNLVDFEYNRENYSTQNDILSTVAQSFFGRTFDFVRKIEEGNGTVIYMYGYGEKVLIVNNDGIIEYKEERTGTNKDTGYLDSLETGLSFIAAHGGFESTNDSAYQPYLIKVESNFDKRNGYRFTIGLKVNGQKIYYQEKAPIVVEVMQGQVTYFSRNLVEYDSAMVGAKEFEYKEASSPINMLAQNYDYFKSEMGMTGVFEEIAGKVTGIEPGYVLVREKDPSKGKAKAAWVVSFEKTEVYFDLYSASPIGYRKNKE